jgi:hypothetical protein
MQMGCWWVPPEDVESVMEEALKRQEREKTVIQRLRDGEHLADISIANKIIREV